MSVLSLLTLSSKKKLPIIFQTERAECGHACLVMIAGWFGYQTDLTTLRKAYPTSSRGVSLWEMVHICEQINLNTRALRLEPETLYKLQCPSILHWDMNHFVVLKKVTKKYVIIHDPAFGEVKYSVSELGKHFTGIALEVWPGNDFEQVDHRHTLTLRDIIGAISGWKKQIITILGLSFTIEAGAILIPLFTQLVLDKVLPANNLSLLYLLGMAFMVIASVKVIAESLRNWVIIYVMNTLNMQITSNLMQHMIALPLAFFEKRSVGDILSRFYSTDEIQQKITTDFVQVVVDGAMTMITLIMMVIYSIKLTAIALLCLVVTLLFRMMTYAKLRKYTEEQVICEAREKSQVIETLRAMLPLTIFNKQSLRLAQWQAAHANTLNASIAQNKMRLLFSTVSHLIFVLENIALIFSGAFFVLHQQLSAGMMIAYLAFATQFSDKVQSLVDKLTDYKMVSLYLARLSDIVFQEKSVKNIPKSFVEARHIRGNLSVKKLSFRYDKQAPFLFHNLSLEFIAGQSTAIIAPSGFGKTSLMKVLMHLLPAEEGEILLDGHPVSYYGTETFLSLCAAVMQDDQLLSGSLLENICFFSEKPDRGKAAKAAKLACIHDDIQAMPMGYHTLVGEMGSHLSGGQRQRLLIARALYREPKILFMDEATSHLDEETEQQVNTNIKSLPVTRIIIAHRKTTIEAADSVIDLTDRSFYSDPAGH